MKGMKIIVKNRKLLVFIVLLISSAVSKGQIYKYIGLEDGLNNQKIYHIQKDRRGYMWFLTQEGVYGSGRCIMGNRAERTYFQV